MIDSLIVKLPSNKHLCVKCTKIGLAAGLRPDPLGSLSVPPDHPTAIEGELLLSGGTFQLTGFRTAQLHWNTRPITGMQSSQ